MVSMLDSVRPGCSLSLKSPSHMNLDQRTPKQASSLSCRVQECSLPQSHFVVTITRDIDQEDENTPDVRTPMFSLVILTGTLAKGQPSTHQTHQLLQGKY